MVFQLINGFYHCKTGIETNKILCIDKWRPQITESCQEAWAVALKYEMKHENKHGNIPSHPMPHQYCPAQNSIPPSAWLWGMRHRMTWYVAMLVFMLHLTF